LTGGERYVAHHLLFYSPTIVGIDVDRSSSFTEFLLLQDNNLTGSLPAIWNFRKLFYLDLGNNQLTGSLPLEWTEQMISLRLLYLGRNQLAGRLPVRLGEIGNGRLELLSIHSNAFTGIMPTFYNDTKKLNVMEIQNNDLSGMDNAMCKYSVFEQGELVRLNADCNICPCKNLCNDGLCYDNNNNNININNNNRKLF
jgi:hypothetical protein